jgi:putative ubiquitin-RnfH superfamily antitoxin RatB of RatAB toxin-antitoxin module
MRVTVRFYEELNDYIPEEIRKTDIEIDLPDGSSIENLIMKYGIPGEDIHLALVNGRNSTLQEKLKDKDRISLYPVFDTIDISSIRKIKKN